MRGARSRVLSIQSAGVMAAILAHAATAYANPIPEPSYGSGWMPTVPQLPLLAQIAVALLLALPLEVAVAALCRLRGRALLLVLGLNLVTVPIANAVARGFDSPILWIEIAVVLVEAAALLLVLGPHARPGVMSLVAIVLAMNLVSYLAGVAATDTLAQAWDASSRKVPDRHASRPVVVDDWRPLVSCPPGGSAVFHADAVLVEDQGIDTRARGLLVTLTVDSAPSVINVTVPTDVILVDASGSALSWSEFLRAQSMAPELVFEVQDVSGSAWARRIELED